MSESKKLLNSLLTEVENVSGEVKAWAEKELAALNAAPVEAAQAEGDSTK